MSDTAQCSKCGYKIELPHSDMVEIFYKEHDCEATKLQEAIHRVRELHKPIRVAQSGSVCKCDNETYPCETIEALDGEQ